MTKAEIIAAVAALSQLKKEEAARAVDALLDVIEGSLKKNETVAFLGFGTFSVLERDARTGRNPQNGQPIEIAASRVPKFAASKAMKARLNPPSRMVGGDRGQAQRKRA